MSFPIPVPDVLIYAGDTFEQTFVFKNPAGEVIDLDAEGWTQWKAQYRCCRDCTDYVDFQVTHTNADEGVITIGLPADQTVNLRKNGYWDLRAKHASVVKTFIASRVEVLRGITRA